MSLPSKSVHVVVLGICLLATVSGCTSAGGHTEVDPSLTLDGAKSTAQRMETELAAYVPGDVVASNGPVRR
ncbi:hypothetical protein SAMN05880568_0095 [Microbacterium sp. RURRCA19A]|nr:hypothetical protein SAMN05880568_0095 [Microbacterium sp. RURRCA19A]